MIRNTAYSILIVDDNHNNLFSLRNLIEEYIDATVLEADCGQVALQKLIRNKVDLIILDIQMEEMDGFELASLIKQRRKTKDIPIVFLTASYLGDEFKKRGFEVGAVDYLTKPIDEYQLINRVNVYLKLIEKERAMNLMLEDKVNQQVEELKKAKEEAEAASESKSTFLANVSHEFRTPLNIIMSITQMLKLYLQDDEIDRRKISQKVDKQVQNCYRLLRLVNNLIDITKIDSGHFDLSISRCNIVGIVEAITLSVGEYVEDKGIKLTFEANVQVEMIECDLDAMERIMLNLLANAIKFTPKGGRIHVKLERLEQNIRISVKDTGIGITEEKIPLIFQRFKQVDELLTRKHEGSGIGLSLVKSLVEMHKGRIYVQSQYQMGTEFFIEIPIDLKHNEDLIKEDLVSSYRSEESVIQKIHVEFSDIYFLDNIF
ncbi:hybrid sensor histidine kinase/response regulator [Alkaliphilus hydrothermalis]|uniref:Stage 0 sporulation protein A homolog n=1 Tax=Alkaliphilus hydrothermalis TaxID=1482730 RepID=A0ABS2NPU3_9FIRM|nr:hybrid sensor histidine kinase/response regulator [Alkaliphilus hydrothermalis]MBM7614960.1 signal transduction histidine kinase [Alkaliphilus hydrothermalis]